MIDHILNFPQSRTPFSQQNRSDIIDSVQHMSTCVYNDRFVSNIILITFLVDILSYTKKIGNVVIR